MAPDTTRPQLPRHTVGAARIEEALAFDDVLFVPSYSQVLPAASDTRTRLTREIGSVSRCFRGDGYRHRSAPWRSPWRSSAASASSTKPCPEEQAAQVRQVKKYESGMVVNPLTVYPDQTLAERWR